MSLVEPAQKTGARFLPKSEPIWPSAHDYRSGKNTHGVDPDRPFDDRIRIHAFTSSSNTRLKKLLPATSGVLTRRAIWD